MFSYEIAPAEYPLRDHITTYIYVDDKLEDAFPSLYDGTIWDHCDAFDYCIALCPHQSRMI